MKKLKAAIKILGFLLLIYSLLRLIFYLIYFRHESIPGSQVLTIFLYGIRMDLTILFFLNLPFWLHFFWIEPWISTSMSGKMNMAILLLINIPFFALSCLDLAYYKFNLRRSTIDLFAVFGDSVGGFWSFLRDFWYCFLIFALVLFFFVRRSRKTLYQSTDRLGAKNYWRQHFLPGLIFLVAFAWTALGPGGKILQPSSALFYLPSQYQPIVSNSAFSMSYSILRRQTALRIKNYFSNEQADALFNIRREYNSGLPFQKRNVVVIIMESFASEYVDSSDRLKAKIPFIDSIMKESMVCENAFANTHESNKGIVALLAGIPAFLDEPFFLSAYNNNKLKGIGTILKERGYSASFYMGGEKDHFGFGRFCRSVGIDDQNWGDENFSAAQKDDQGGVFDHYFLPHAAELIKKKQEPFFGVIYSMSMHYPYELPAALKSQFTIPGQNREQNSVTYFDYSLRLFFDRIRDQSWYKNTVFVFVSDHSVGWHVGEKAVLYKGYRIPFFIHDPSKPVGQNIKGIIQQLDLVPTILDYLNYERPFMSFGESVLRGGSGKVFNMHNGNFQLITPSGLLGYSDRFDKSVYLYDYRRDPGLENNLLDRSDANPRKDSLERILKAVIQRFNQSLINNQLIID